MLHVRLVTPAEVTPRVVGSLAADSGVLNLVVLSAAARRPAGDAIQFDVTNASAGAVLARLQALGLDPDGPVAVDSVGATIAEPGRDAAHRRTYHGERAPVWPVIEARIDEDAEYAPSFFALLAFAGIIAACGILINSQILIVGAMVVGPEYSAIVAVALGLERRNWQAVRTGLLVLVAGFLLAIVVTTIFALCIRGSGRTPALYLDGFRPVSDLINSPNLFSVVVAVVAGIVGVISLTLSKAGALIGVFISITTIPAAADIGLSAAYGSWSEAGGSALQLLLNVGLLIIIGALALRGQRRIWRSWNPPAPQRPEIRN
jgi:uncharacterized hydrophobic protein (TIGR00271 family)